MQKRVVCAPSILAADFTRIEDSLNLIRDSGATQVHCDVMDGHFVPNLSFGPKMIADIRKKTSLKLDVHLMITNPEDSIRMYIDAGADAVTFHLEACVHAHRTLQFIRANKVEAGIAIVPSTPVSALSEVLDELDMVLIMSVNPGFGGQEFIPRSLLRVSELAACRGDRTFKISVDGGVNLDTGARLSRAGADVLVAGTAFFSQKDPREFVKTMEALP